MNNKAQAYEFLLRLILAILFVGAAIFIGKSLFASTDSASSSYNSFVFAVNNLKDGQFKEVGVDFDKNAAIIGFNQGAEQFESSSIYAKFDKSIIKKPQNSECTSNACICLCRKSSYENLITRTPELICESLTCKKLESGLDIIDIYEIKNELLDIEIRWKGGFVYGRDIKATINGLENYKPRTRVLRIENYKNIISVCPSEQKECLSKEDKELLDQRIKEKSENKLNEELQKSFQAFINSLNGCKEDINNCGTINFRNGYNIYYIPRIPEPNDHGVYLLKQVSDPDIQEHIMSIENNEIKDLQISPLFKNADEELDEGYIFENNKAIINSEDGNLIITQ